MTDEEKIAICCAYADLCGAMQARAQGDVEIHDWKSHRVTIEDLEEMFSFIIPVKPETLG